MHTPKFDGSRWRRWFSKCPALVVGLSAILLLPLLGGCESLGYYAHVAGGQWQLLRARQPVSEVLAELAEADAEPDAASSALAARLEESQRVLLFAEQQLLLPVGGRYRSYVDLDRPAVVWNLVAAPPLSLEPHTWCYPFVGCAPYRGFFDEARLERQRERLEAGGLETHTGGVSAYSTLGWFDDPLLSTFIDLDEAEFVELLIHELAHSRVWVKGDVAFNESFASFVGTEGAREWFAGSGRDEVPLAHQASRRHWARARVMLAEARDVLGAIYSSAADEDVRLAAKASVLAAAADCLERYARQTGIEGYRRLIPRLNNAYLASLATYDDAVPAFSMLFSDAAGDWAAFFDEVEKLAALDQEVRWQRLTAAGHRADALGISTQQHVAAEGDDQGTDEVQCEAFPRHDLDGEAAGA